MDQNNQTQLNNQSQPKTKSKKKSLLVTFIIAALSVFCGMAICIMSSGVLSPDYSDTEFLIGYYGAFVAISCIISIVGGGFIVLARKLLGL